MGKLGKSVDRTLNNQVSGESKHSLSPVSGVRGNDAAGTQLRLSKINVCFVESAEVC